MTDAGLKAIGAGIAILAGMACSFGEANVVCKTIEGISRNPENEQKLRSTMILGVALVETCGIYALLIAILIIFVLGGK